MQSLPSLLNCHCYSYRACVNMSLSVASYVFIVLGGSLPNMTPNKIRKFSPCLLIRLQSLLCLLLRDLDQILLRYPPYNCEVTMFESQRQSYEYHLNLLSVKMKVKFPCRMKIQHLGSLVTGQSPPSDDNRFIFNQEIILKDESQQDHFELTINLLTDKGAKYIAGIIKLYKSELIRSQGERLVLSLTKCIDGEAFCEVKVDQVSGTKINKNVPYDRKSTLQREVPYRKEANDIDLSPYRNPTKVLESKSEYQFPLNHNTGVRHDWETKSRSRMIPPQTVYQKSKVAQKVNYAIQTNHYNGFDTGQSVILGRQKAMEAEVYKQGYQKLKEKYKKQAENTKQELNKRLALQNTENNLKLELMRLKLKVEEQEKSLSDRNNKIKEYQNQVSLLQQKEIDNGYLKEELNKKETMIKGLEDKIRSLTRNLEETRELASQRTTEEVNKIKELQVEVEGLKIKLQSKEREFEKEMKAKIELLHAKEVELISRKDSLERERKTVSDLQKALQGKSYELDKLLQNEKNNSKTKIDELKSKMEKQERQIQKLQEEKRDFSKEIEHLKNNTIKIEYDKRILAQELESIRSEYNECKAFREKYNEISRDNRSLIEEKVHLQRQLQRTIQNKEFNISEINKQYQDQVEYYKKINRQLDEKNKAISNKLIESQGQLELSRNQQDKLRRNLQASIKEAADAKEKEKTIKKALKNKEHESLSFESQHATLKQKLKSIEQIYKLEVDKVRQEGEKLRIQLENELDRLEQLGQSNSQLNMEVNRLKIKLQYAQQKNQKDAANIKEKQQHIESLIKDYEEQVTALDQNVNALRLIEKEQSTKIQRYELEAIKSQERSEKAKKEIKILEQRYNNQQNVIRNKATQYQALAAEKDTYVKKVQEIESQCNGLKTDIANLTNQRNKLQKMNDILQEQLKKTKLDIGNSLLSISEKQKNEESLRNQIKEQKEQYAKLDSKYNAFRKQTERYRETLNDTIQKYLITLPLVVKEDGKKLLEDFMNKRSSENTFNDLINLIISQTKEVKQVLNKNSEQIKQLQRENERAHEEASQSSNKYQNSESIMKTQIENLEKQLAQAFQQRQFENANFSSIIADLDERVKSLEIIEEELNTQIQELNFTINSLKMDSDAMNDQNSKKICNLKKLNGELQEKIEYQVMTITQLDERCGALQCDMDNLQITIQNETQASHRKDKLIEELKELKESHESTIEELKKQKKELSERVSELELHLNTERQYKDKTKSLLQEEQSKANDLKNFISNLMRQKEAAIKSDLERSEKLIEMEAELLNVNKELQLLKEQNDRNVKTLEQQRQQNKKLSATIKQMDNEKKDEKVKHTKTQEKLKEKEKELLNKEESMKKSEAKYQKTIEKLKYELKQLQQQLQYKSNNNLELSKENNERMIALQNQLHKKESQINNLQSKLTQFEEMLFGEREKNILADEQMGKLKADNQQLKTKISYMDSSLNEMADQSKEKEERLFQFSGKIYTLQLRLQSRQRETNDRLENLNQQWINKYQSMCEEYEQRMQLIEKQRDYFKGLSQEKDREISKQNQLIKTSQTSQANQRRSYEEKVRRLEEEKLSLYTQKSNEIQRLVEEVKTLSDNLKQKEIQLRRLSNQLEVARKTITNLDNKSKEYDEKIKGINKVYQTELQQLKKKDTVFKSYKESVSTHQWNVQRETKKTIQNFIKNFLEISEDKNSTKIIELVRGLEKTIMQILAVKPNEK